jgi:thiol-disulfide isomerase/thioredoxin
MGPCAWQGGAGFQLPGRDGRKRSLGSLLGTADRKPLALVFCGPECGPCADFMPELIAFDDEHAASVTLALITARRRDQRDIAAAERRLRHVLLQEDREVWRPTAPRGRPAASWSTATG